MPSRFQQTKDADTDKPGQAGRGGDWGLRDFYIIQNCNGSRLSGSSSSVSFTCLVTSFRITLLGDHCIQDTLSLRARLSQPSVRARARAKVSYIQRRSVTIRTVPK